MKTTLIRKKLVYLYQPGFRTNHSTEFYLVQLIDFVLTNMDKHTHTNMILVDLQKNFDAFDHRVLLDKLYNFDFQTSAII